MKKEAPTTVEEIQAQVAMIEAVNAELDFTPTGQFEAELKPGTHVRITGATDLNAHLNGQEGVVHCARRRVLATMDSKFIETVKARNGRLPLEEFYRVIPVGRFTMHGVEIALDGVEAI